MLAMIKPALLPAVEAEWRDHLTDGLGRLRRTPSGAVRRDCDIILAHPELFDLSMLLRMAAGALSQEERDRRAALSQSLHPPDAEPVFMLRAGLGWQIQQARDDADRDRLQAALDAIAGVDTPKAPALRKLLFPLLAARFGARPSRFQGSEYRLALGQAGGVAATLCLDFGRMARGIAWEVELEIAGLPRHLRAASYETLLGVGVGQWDVFRTDTVEVDLALLVQRVGQALGMLKGVDWRDTAWP